MLPLVCCCLSYLGCSLLNIQQVAASASFKQTASHGQPGSLPRDTVKVGVRIDGGNENGNKEAVYMKSWQTIADLSKQEHLEDYTLTYNGGTLEGARTLGSYGMTGDPYVVGEYLIRAVPKQNSKPVPSPADTGNSNCYDYENGCAYWAKSGECSSNPGFMLHQCKKSCNTCVSQSAIVNSQICDCGWIANDDCKSKSQCAVSCRRYNSWGPCGSR
mmetsp:Transcript_59112/g.105103  ORF Transcript_59112/g.105103 Transcript_59112/m.105103 type:complete len:216 (+) Transcript_59112:107-754(+)